MVPSGLYCGMSSICAMAIRVADKAEAQIKIAYESYARYHCDTVLGVAMTLRLSDEQAEALRLRAEKEGRSMQQIALSAVDDYLVRTEDDEVTDRLAERGAQRFAELLRRLGE
jgi:predicted transcriptional regulator